MQFNMVSALIRSALSLVTFFVRSFILKKRFAYTTIATIGVLFVLLVPHADAQALPGGQEAITGALSTTAGQYKAILKLPDDYASTTQTYPLLVFLHGAGEAGSNLASIYGNSVAGGPSYFAAQGQWPASFTNPVTGSSYKFIVVSPQHPGWSYAGADVNSIISNIVSRYRVDTNRIYVTGLSAGGEGTWKYAIHTTYSPTYLPAAIVPMSPAIEAPTATQAQSIISDAIRTWGIGSDPADIHGIRAHQIVDLLNGISAGFARYTNYSGGHCCWNNFYNPTYRENIGGTSMSIYEWMLQYTRGSTPPPPPPPPSNNSPTANAGADQTITAPTNSVTLTGSATDTDGTIASYTWTAVSGGPATIASPSSATTQVTGLSQGTYVFRLTATDNGGATGSDTVTIFVNGAVAATPTPYGGTPISIPGTIQAEAYDNGGQSIAYNDSTAGNAAGTLGYRVTEGVDVETTTDTGGGYNIGWTVGGEWTTYSVDVASSGTYTLQARVASQLGNAVLRIELDGAAIATVNVPNTGGWQLWQTVRIPNISLAAGKMTLRMYTVTGGYNINWVSFVAGTQPPSNNSPTANAGADQTIMVPTNSVTLTGSATDTDGTIASYTWTKVSGQGTITTPNLATTTITGLTTAGTATFRLTVTDNAGASASDEVVVVVGERVSTNGCSSNRIYLTKAADNGVRVPQAQPGDTFVLRASDGPFSWVYITGARGTAACPITLTNEGGQAYLTKQITVENSSYVVIDGNGSPSDQYGIKIESPSRVNVGVSIAAISDHIEVHNVYITNTKYGFWIKQEAACDPSLQYPNIVLNDISVHDVKITNTESQGFYMGTTAPNGGRSITCNGQSVDLRPGRLGNIKIYNNYIEGTGRPGIQLASANGGLSEIYNNTVKFAGRQYDDQQGAGIIIGTYTRANIHHNNIDTTYSWGIASIGGTYVQIENNTIAKSGWLDTHPQAWPQNIYIDTRPTIPTEKTTFIVRNNTVSMPGSGVTNLYVEKTVATYGPDSVICNNTLPSGVPATLGLVFGVPWKNCGGASSNNSPTANAGADQTIMVPTNSVTLTGSATDTDGTIASYTWTKVSGQGTITTPNLATTTITGLTTAGTATFRLTVTDNAGASASDEVVVVVGTTVQVVQTPYEKTAATIPGKIEAEAYDLGGAGTAYNDTTNANEAVQYGSTFRTSEGVDTERAADTGAGYDVGWIQANEWLEYTVVVQNTDVYTLEARVASPFSGKSFRVEADGVPIATISVPNTGGYQKWLTVSLPNVSLAKGEHVLRMYMLGDGFNINWISFTSDNTPVSMNKKPVIRMNTDTETTLPRIKLSAIATDSDGVIVSVLWSEVTGPTQATIANRTSFETDATDLVNGVYTFAFVATDNSGDTASGTVSVSVAQPAVGGGGIGVSSGGGGGSGGSGGGGSSKGGGSSSSGGSAVSSGGSGGGGSANTTPSRERARVTATVLNVRSAPNGKIISTVTRGSIGSVLLDTGSWLRVTFDTGTTGWVSKPYTAVAAPTQTPTPTVPVAGCEPGMRFSPLTGKPCTATATHVSTQTPPADTTVTAGATVTTTATVLNVRSAPNGAVIAKVIRGTVASVLGTANGWTKVRFATGVEGYVSSLYIR